MFQSLHTISSLYRVFSFSIFFEIFLSETIVLTSEAEDCSREHALREEKTAPKDNIASKAFCFTLSSILTLTLVDLFC